MKDGQAFLIDGCGDAVYVRCRANVRGATSTEEIPVVVIVDPDQHETQGSYQSPGTMFWVPAYKAVTPLRLTSPPQYEV